MRDDLLPGREVIERRFEEIYAEHFNRLLAVAVGKFRVPDAEAEGLVHEVFLAYLRRQGDIEDVRAWMLAGIADASRYYWRKNGKAVEPLGEEAFEWADPATSRILDSLPDQIAASEALSVMRPRDREILKMRYLEGYSFKEIGERLGVTPKYAQKLLTMVVRRVQRRLQPAYALQGARAGQAEVGTWPARQDWRKSEGLREVLTNFIEAYRNL